MIGQLKLFAWFVITCGLCGLENAGAINILGIVSSLSKSHSVFANSIFNEYANSGHSVTVLSPYDVSLRINHYKLHELERIKKNFKSNTNILVDEYTATLQSYEEGLATTKAAINHENFKRLASASLNVDIIIFDYDYNDALLAFVRRYNCPVFIILHNQPSLSLKRLINPSYPFANLMFLRPAAETGIASAVWNALTNLYEKFVVNFYYMPQQEKLFQKIEQDLGLSTGALPTELIVKIFTNSMSSLPISTSNIANIPALQIPDKSIFEYFVSDPLDQFIHSTDAGCIYVSLGSDTDPATLPKDKIYKMFEVFNRRPEKIVWAWNGNTTIFQGSNKFFIHSWMPQDDILRHRNIKAFVTNGGTMSLQEGIYHEVPMVGIPLTHQQQDSIESMAKKGIGVKIDLSDLTVESFAWALNEIIDNDRYKQKLAFEADLLKNKAIAPMKLVKYWIKYYHQYRNEDVIEKPGLSVVDFYLSDLYLLMFIILSMSTIISVIFCYKLYNFASHKFSQPKLKYY